MRTKQVFALMVFLLVVMAGCARAEPIVVVEQFQPPTTGSESILISNRFRLGVTRIVDKEAGVVCWVYKGLDRGGIDCLPISQTQLDP